MNPTMNRHFFPRAAVLAYLAIHGPTSTLNLYQSTGRVTSLKSFHNAMYQLRAFGFVNKVQGSGLIAVWGVAPDGLSALPKPKPEVTTEPHVYPRYCLDPVARAPQRNTHTAAWVPPVIGCTRAGAQDFLALPSLVGEERRAHTASYVAALAGPRQPRARP